MAPKIQAERVLKCCGNCDHAVQNPQNENQVNCIFNPPHPIVFQVKRDDNGVVVGIEQLSVFPVLNKGSVCKKFDLRKGDLEGPAQ